MDIDHDVEARKTADWVQWAENDSTENDDIAFITYEDGELTEQHFALAVFLHWSNVRRKENRHDIC